MFINSYQEKLLKTLNPIILYGSFALILLGASTYSLEGGIKYCKYAPILFLPLLPLLFHQKKSLLWFQFLILGAIVSICVVKSKFGLEDLVFLTAAITPFLLVKNIQPHHIDKIFYMTIGFLCLQMILQRSEFQLVFSFANSETLFECTYSFTFGFFVLYYVIEKKHLKMVAALLFMLITMKRIALLGVFVLIPLCLYRKNHISPILLVLMNAVPVLLIVGLMTDVRLVSFIENLFGLDIHKLTLGRFLLWQDAALHVSNNPFVGMGWGNTYKDPITEGLVIYGKFNLHSDVLKVLSEFGLIFFIVFFWLFYLIKDIKVQIFAIYFNILMFTDNTLIYTDVLVFLFLFSEYYAAKAKEPAVETALENKSDFPLALN